MGAPEAVIGGLKVGLVVPAYNEGERLRSLLPRIDRNLVDCVVVVNDGSSDETSAAARTAGAEVIDREARGGPGAAIRDGLLKLRGEGVDLVAVMAANGKHRPEELKRLLEPLAVEELDLVRGSRHLPGARHENMPRHRLWLIRLFTLLFSALSGRRVTDATGGFQAYRLCILDDPRVDIHQSWLHRYELETYLFAKTLMLGYRWKEVPVSITYPGGKQTYTRARPLLDWWGYFRPVVLLRLGLKR